ncbi:MAG: response regulator [Ignavibacteria bacterium]|jgi:DNA-binding response OmpR family regulator|nr:response regulator [Ignavibacteria bacterium]
MLVVEDDDLSQRIFKLIFKNNFEIDICESSDEYYEKYYKTNYSIIIMDVSISGSLNGLELMKKIKEDPEFVDTPIICLTAHAQPKMRLTAVEAGADIFLTKPVNNKILREAVESLLLSEHSRIKQNI